jgi:hypothetical protein
MPSKSEKAQLPVVPSSSKAEVSQTLKEPELPEVTPSTLLPEHSAKEESPLPEPMMVDEEVVSEPSEDMQALRARKNKVMRELQEEQERIELEFEIKELEAKTRRMREDAATREANLIETEANRVREVAAPQVEAPMNTYPQMQPGGQPHSQAAMVPQQQ